jgi:hypothetical protein
MNESLASACGEFEQFLLAGMLRSAGIGRPVETDGGSEAGFAFASSGESEAVSQLFVQALAGALERAGGIGIARGLQSALGKERK